MIILAVKPQIMAAVLRRGRRGRSTAGSSSSRSPRASPRRTSATHLGKPARLIRVMPNTPALVLEGVTAIARAEGLEPGDLETAQELFGAVGRVVVLDEDAPRRGHRALGLRARLRGHRDRVAGRRRREDGARPRHRHDAGRPDRARLGASSSSRPARIRASSRTWCPRPAAPPSPASRRSRRAGVRRTFISAVERATLRSRELGNALTCCARA